MVAKTSTSLVCLSVSPSPPLSSSYPPPLHFLHCLMTSWTAGINPASRIAAQPVVLTTPSLPLSLVSHSVAPSLCSLTHIPSHGLSHARSPHTLLQTWSKLLLAHGTSRRATTLMTTWKRWVSPCFACEVYAVAVCAHACRRIGCMQCCMWAHVKTRLRKDKQFKGVCWCLNSVGSC